MRASLALLGVALAACSSHTGATYDADATVADSTSFGARLDNMNKPQVTPLGTAADKDSSAARSLAPSPATAGVPRAPAPTGWPTPFKAAYTGCTRTAVRAATILSRPLTGASKFGQLTVGDKVGLEARTTDGWVGFNPGSAQAGNVGIFRLRWVRASEAFAPGDSGIARLPVVPAPPLGCLLMADHDTPVQAHPSPGTARLSTIPAGSYAQVLKASVGTGKWVEILVPGTKAHGYVAPGNSNFSGDCQ